MLKKTFEAYHVVNKSPSFAVSRQFWPEDAAGTVIGELDKGKRGTLSKIMI